jgi:hypothetical protein
MAAKKRKCTAQYVLRSFTAVRPGEPIRRPDDVGKHSWSQAVRRLRTFGYDIEYHRADDTWSLNGIGEGDDLPAKVVRHTITDAELDILADLVAEKLEQRLIRRKRTQC